jgi:hypothetical protein
VGTKEHPEDFTMGQDIPNTKHEYYHPTASYVKILYYILILLIDNGKRKLTELKADSSQFDFRQGKDL